MSVGTGRMWLMMVGSVVVNVYGDLGMVIDG